jgi:hypothetical protein
MWLVLPGYLRRLPVNDLPFAATFEKGAAVQIARDFRLVAFRCRADETKRNDGGVAVLLYADVFGAVIRLFFARFGSAFRAHFTQNISLAEAAPDGAGVDEILGPEPFVSGEIIARGAGEKVFQKFD